MERSPSARSSSTPTTSSRRPPASLRRPPGWTIVYGRPDSTRYTSAFRFQSRMLPPAVVPSGSVSRPSALSMLDGSVPPIEEQMTTWVPSPHALAASICAFWPSQSTSRGWPFGNAKTGRPVASSVSPVGAGLADVPMISASHPCIAAAIASASVTSATAMHSAGTPLATSASRLSAVRTIPSGANCSGRDSILRNACWPVWPPAPVTATRSGAARPATKAMQASIGTIWSGYEC
mmetsp:Transcript_28681/g.67221  ORF Transcript_28681/g.67221 Transcript_28681/m.67221 type:complete len:235 (-) Transcript_28681:41-745(-)